MEYADQLYDDFLKDPNSVDPKWKMFFEGIEFAKTIPEASSTNTPSTSAEATSNITMNELNVYRLIRSFRDFGHLKSNLDPLGLVKPNENVLKLSDFDLNDTHLEQSFYASKYLDKPNMKLKDILKN